MYNRSRSSGESECPRHSPRSACRRSLSLSVSNPGISTGISRGVIPSYGTAEGRIGRSAMSATNLPRHACSDISIPLLVLPSTAISRQSKFNSIPRVERQRWPGDQLSTYLQRCDIDFRDIRPRGVYIVIYRPRLIDSSIRPP